MVSQPRKKSWPRPGKTPITSATGAKASSSRTTTWARITATESAPSSAKAPSSPGEDHEGEQQPLVLAVLAHRVGGRLVGGTEAVALAVLLGRLGGVAVVERVVVLVALVGVGRGSFRNRGAYLLRLLTQTLPAARISSDRASRRESAASWPGSRESGRDRNGGGVVAVVGSDAVLAPAELQDDPRLDRPAARTAGRPLGAWRGLG